MIHDMTPHQTNWFWLNQQLFQKHEGNSIKAGSAAAASGNMSGAAAASFCGEDESDNQAGQNKPCTQSLEIFSHMKPSGLKLQLGLQQQDDRDIHPALSPY